MRNIPMVPWIAVALLFGVGASGCVKPVENAKTAQPKQDDHGHEHVHHGPHGGHLMVIGEEEYHAEWTHDENGQVTFYILDAAAKNEVPLEADHLKIDVKIGDNPAKTYELVAVNAKDGKASSFQIVDKQFAGLFDQLKSSGVTLTLHATIAGKHFSQPVKEHDHGH